MSISHPDDILPIANSSGRPRVQNALCHPDHLGKLCMSSGWHNTLATSHPDEILPLAKSSGWLTINSLCHPDGIPFHLMSSGWLNWGWYLIRMSYGSVIMSSGWDTLRILTHQDEIANFDFPHHAVAVQRFRTDQLDTLWHIALEDMYTYSLSVVPFVCQWQRQSEALTRAWACEAHCGPLRPVLF